MIGCPLMENNYTPEQIERIEDLASIYMTISDMALLLDLDEAKLRIDINGRTEVAKVYRRGKAKSKEKLLRQEMELAQTGSPEALENTRKNLLDMEDDE